MLLDVNRSKNLIKKYKIPFVKSFNAKNRTELKEAIKKTNFPIAMKIISKSIMHKLDVGGVALNINSINEATKVLNNFKKLDNFEGVLIQPMLLGIEIIIGGKNDPQFGPIILFGLGGTFVEVFKDFSIRICPITRKDAKEMIREIKSFKILEGTRGKEGINLTALEDCLINASKLLIKEKIKELDINPLIANKQTVIGIDARVILE